MRRFLCFLFLAAPVFAAPLHWGVRGWYAISNPSLGDPFSLNAYLKDPQAHHGNPLTPADVARLEEEYGSVTGNTERWVRILYDWVPENEWRQYKDVFIRLYQHQLIVRPNQEKVVPPAPTPQEIMAQIIAQKEDLAPAVLPLQQALPLQLQLLPSLDTGAAHRFRGDKAMGYAVYILHDTKSYGLLVELIGGVFTAADNHVRYPWVYTPLINLPTATTLREFGTLHDLLTFQL